MRNTRLRWEGGCDGARGGARAGLAMAWRGAAAEASARTRGRWAGQVRRNGGKGGKGGLLRAQGTSMY